MNTGSWGMTILIGNAEAIIFLHDGPGGLILPRYPFATEIPWKQWDIFLPAPPAGKPHPNHCQELHHEDALLFRDAVAGPLE